MADFLDPMPCGPYTTPEAVLACCEIAQQLGLTDDDVRLIDAIEDASLLLYYWTGRTYGTCTTTLRLCRGCTCTEMVCCCGVNSIDLGVWPVVSLDAIRMNGEEQDVADFHIDEWHYLVRSGVQDPWPTCSNLWAEAGGEYDDEANGYVFEVDLTYGVAVPHILERAARTLACELLNDACAGQCKLPERVTSISRRGMSVEVASSQDLLGDKLTGIYVVDLAISTLNPSKLQSPSFVWTPQLRRNRNRRVYT
jgi:hypothetical protein